MATYLITGIAGFIGSNIARTLLAQAPPCAAWITSSPASAPISKTLAASTSSRAASKIPEICARACQGVEFVFHEAALASVPRSVEDPAASNSANVDRAR